jgi:cell division protein FtsB
MSWSELTPVALNVRAYFTYLLLLRLTTRRFNTLAQDMARITKLFTQRWSYFVRVQFLVLKCFGEGGTSKMLEIEKYVAAYRKIRDVIKEKELQYKQDVEDLKEQQDMISNKLLEFCNAENLDSVKTQEGTISRRVSTRYWTSDWEQMHQFIKDNDAMHLLEPRIQQTNMKQFIEENPDKLPIGLQSNSEYKISVRKPYNK